MFYGLQYPKMSFGSDSNLVDANRSIRSGILQF